jgi:SAM-dependent methyltransferase
MSQEAKKDVYEQVGVAMTCRSFSEYESMFQLTEELLKRGPVLDVAAGASSFAASVCDLGGEAAAVDPLYALEPDVMFEHGVREIEESTAKLRSIAHTFDWGQYGSLEGHREKRERSLELFIRNYREDRAEQGDFASKQRYVAANLPELPFADNTFALIVSSHFLFLYHEQFDYSFHVNAIRELLRVCRPGGEIRLYPLIVMNRDPYPHLDALIETLQRDGHSAKRVPTSFRFLAGAEHFLRVVKHVKI